MIFLFFKIKFRAGPTSLVDLGWVKARSSPAQRSKNIKIIRKLGGRLTTTRGLLVAEMAAYGGRRRCRKLLLAQAVVEVASAGSTMERDQVVVNGCAGGR